MDRIVLIIIAVIGATGVQYLIRYKQWNAVRASSLLALLVAVIFKLAFNGSSNYLVNAIPPLFLGATFVGMVSAKQTSSFISIGLAAVLYSLLFIYSGKYYQGYGGLLGTTACVSLLVVLSSKYLKSNKKLRLGLRKLARTGKNVITDK